MSAQDIAELLDRIRSMDDVVARNRHITRCYRDLAVALAGVMGRRDVNWFGFGAWASGTAGRSIRGEGMPFDFGSSRQVAAGNLAIIEDVAPPFIHWLHEIERAQGPTRSAAETVLGDADLAPRLASAIGAYQNAIDHAHANDPDDDVHDKAIAESVLMGNVLVGSHEQELVDPFIDSAMPLCGVFGLITSQYVFIKTPEGRLDVTRDIPRPAYLAGAQFPAPLLTLEHVELTELARRFDHALDTDVSRSNAWSWESYHERMGFIFAFFRAYQRDERLFDVPATFLPDDL